MTLDICREQAFMCMLFYRAVQLVDMLTLRESRQLNCKLSSFQACWSSTFLVSARCRYSSTIIVELVVGQTVAVVYRFYQGTEELFTKAGDIGKLHVSTGLAMRVCFWRGAETQHVALLCSPQHGWFLNNRIVLAQMDIFPTNAPTPIHPTSPPSSATISFICVWLCRIFGSY